MPEHPTTFTFAITSDHPDANGNQADISGWVLDRFHENPVVFFDHQWHIPPIGRASNLATRQGQMFADIEFAPSNLGLELAKLVANDFMIGASVGWKPLDWEFSRDDNNRIIGIHSHRQELLEISIVGLPAQADTLKAALLEATHTISPDSPYLTSMEERLQMITGPTNRLIPVIRPPKPTSIESVLAAFSQKLRGSP